MSSSEAPGPGPAGGDDDAGGVALAIEAKPRPLGGIEVARALPVMQRRSVGPFVFLDHMGPAPFAPGTGFDVLPHPHIGLSTVTYLFEGESVHRDSIGCVQTIRPGDVNLMTAGRGVVHSERTGVEERARGGTLHGLQLWLGLPRANEEDEPSFEHHPRDAFPEITAGRARVRVLLGAALGVASPIVHPSRPWLLEAEMPEGASFAVEASDEERAVYVIEGEVAVGRRAFGGHRLLVAAPSAAMVVTARRPSRVAALGGPPLDGKRFMDWNFVSSSPERIERAKAAWRAGELPRIPGDDQERVEYPEARRS